MDDKKSEVTGDQIEQWRLRTFALPDSLGALAFSCEVASGATAFQIRRTSHERSRKATRPGRGAAAGCVRARGQADAIRPSASTFGSGARDLKRRVAPAVDRARTVPDDSQGVTVDTIRVERYWRQRRLAQVERGQRLATRPTLLASTFTSFTSLEREKRVADHITQVARLDYRAAKISTATNPTAHGGSEWMAFEVVIPSLPATALRQADGARVERSPSTRQGT